MVSKSDAGGREMCWDQSGYTVGSGLLAQYYDSIGEMAWEKKT
jgi:hypothetical protein